MIRRLEHAALSVSDMDRSLAFYRDLLGMTVIRDLAPGLGGNKLGTVVGMPHCRARIVHLDLGGTMLELFQYVDPVGRALPTDHRQADIGFTHIGLSSNDVRADYGRLKAEGVAFISEPVEFRAGVWIVYFRGPDGEVCELRQGEE
ncbi:MAG: VOC family protein [Lentisphaerae bacterium]|nr:VOC family protein [Lentisphaerota bacterium]